MSRFQLNSSKLFLTYPQCNVSREFALGKLSELVAPLRVNEYVIASELHKNGDDHLHAYLALSGPFRTRCATSLDLVSHDDMGVRNVYHGNYQGCRSAKNVLRYVTKEDNYLSNIDVAVALSKRSTRDVIAKQLINDKRKLEDLIPEHPCLIFGYARLKHDLISYQEDIAPAKADLPPFLPNPWGKVLPTCRQRKRRHFWIYSRQPNLGKTYHFALPLGREFRAVVAAGDFSYWNVSRHTQLLILDDYNSARLKYDALNTICDGTFSFKVIYRGSVTIDRYLVVVLSNQPLHEVYPNMNYLLYERFNEIELV